MTDSAQLKGLVRRGIPEQQMHLVKGAAKIFKIKDELGLTDSHREKTLQALSVRPISFLRSNLEPNYSLSAFKLIQIIGEGRCSVVFEASHAKGSFALKKWSTCHLDIPRKELKFLRELNHPIILKVFGAFMEDLPYMVTELCFGHLEDYAGFMSEKDVLQSCAQLVNGVAYLQSKNIVHSNLRMRNILVKRSNTVAVTGFSYAEYIQENDYVIKKEAHGYPAILNLEALTQKKFSFRSDNHALALIFFELDRGQPLQYVPHVEQTYELYVRVLTEGYPGPKPDGQVTNLEDRIKVSQYNQILAKMIDPIGCSLVLEFFKDAFVAQRMKEFGIFHESIFYVDKYFARMRVFKRLLFGPKSVPETSLWNAIYDGFYYVNEDEVPLSKPGGKPEENATAEKVLSGKGGEKLFLAEKNCDFIQVAKYKKIYANQKSVARAVNKDNLNSSDELPVSASKGAIPAAFIDEAMSKPGSSNSSRCLSKTSGRLTPPLISTGAACVVITSARRLPSPAISTAANEQFDQTKYLSPSWLCSTPSNSGPSETSQFKAPTRPVTPMRRYSASVTSLREDSFRHTQLPHISP